MEYLFLTIELYDLFFAMIGYTRLTMLKLINRLRWLIP